MRVTFCTTDGWNAFNGINAWLLRFLPDLRARNHDVRVLLFPWSPPDRCVALPLLRAAGVPVEVVYPSRYTEAGVRACLEHARRSKPDVFVANSVLPALYASGRLRSAGIPSIAVLHSDDDEFRAIGELFAGADPALRASALVVISRGLLRFAAHAPAGFPVRWIPYGVPVTASRAAWDGRAPLRLVYHGRLVREQKRIDETIAACVRVCRAAPDRLAADFYGFGPEEEALVATLKRDDADGRVRFRGRLDPANVMGTLVGYQVAVLLSDYEGLGLSILEGMAAGLVPVCHRTASGLPDIISHGHNGLFVDDRVADFDAAIFRLLDRPGEWSRLADAARLTVAERFSPASSLVAWEELLTTLAPADRQPAHLPHPWRITLPPAHPALQREERRYPGLLRAVWRRMRFPGRG